MADVDKKIVNYRKAVDRLCQAVEEAESQDNSLLRDGTIQRFEFTFELFWKLLRQMLIDDGVSDVKGPRSVIKKSFAIGIIESEEFMNMLDDRNLSAHVYDEETAQKIFQKISSDYVHLLKNFNKK